ncbi:MAG: phage DNA encapsidation protein [Clostridiales bacterium]|nr:phage DNA encapsidation protein [Clostridiales bacterium]
MGKYYDLRNILKTDSTYNIIIGERSNGKTYACLKYGVERYFKTGEQFAIVRRWQTDIRGNRASEMFSALVKNGEIKKLSKGRYEGIHYWAGRFYPCNYNEMGKAIYSDNEVIAYPFSLSDTEHNKSISYPNITTIIFDEFITRQVYLPDEFILFMNTISTIVRDRTNVKIFMLGNTVNKYCPYFNEMGLKDIHKQKQGTIDVYRYGNSKLRVAVEYCRSMGKSKANNFYFAFDNPKLEMIKTGAWELDIYPHLPVKYKPKNVLFTYFIEHEEQLFQCNIILVDNNLFTYIHRKTTEIKNPDKDLIYTLEYNPKINYNRNILKHRNKLEQKIKEFFIHDKVYYQDNEVGEAINNYLMECRRGL